MKAKGPEDYDYLLPLPSPKSITLIAEGMVGTVFDDTQRAISSLERKFSGLSDPQAAGICEELISAASQFPAPSPQQNPASDSEERSAIYDLYFAVNRLPESASKAQILHALVGATALVMRNTEAFAKKSPAVGPVEFGILRQSLAVIVEILGEFADEAKSEERQ